MAQMLEPTNFPKIPDGGYRAEVCNAEYSLTSTGRHMYKVTMVVSEGEQVGSMIIWRLIEVREHPKLLHQYFNALAAFGIDIMTFTSVRDHDEVVRTIISTGRQLDIILRTDRAGWQNVHDFRRIW